MTLNDRIKIFKRSSARNGLFMSYWLITHLPYKVTRIFMRGLMEVAYYLVVRLKRTARESLKIAFGAEKTGREIERIVRDCFMSFGLAMIEMLYFASRPDEIKQHVVIEGEQHLKDALAKGRGVMAVTAHFGNFPLMMLALARLGYRNHVLLRHTRDPQIDKFFLEVRERVGVGTIFTMPRREAVSQSLKVLRNNEIVFVLLDQHFGGEGGIYVDFFGQKAATAVGPIVFAQRTNSPIVMMFISRQPDGSHKIMVEPPFDLEQGRDSDETLFINISRITAVIERYVRKYPHEWGWMHRRWKGHDAAAPSAPTDEPQEEPHGD